MLLNLMNQLLERSIKNNYYQLEGKIQLTFYVST